MRGSKGGLGKLMTVSRPDVANLLRTSARTYPRIDVGAMGAVTPEMPQKLTPTRALSTESKVQERTPGGRLRNR